MEQLSRKTRNPAEDGGSAKTLLRQKSHRKLLSGIKLFKTVRANSGDTTTVPWKNRRPEVPDDENARVPQQQLDLPHDLITYQILTRLHIKSLLQFKSVSREWYSTISSYAFANARFRACLSSYTTSPPIEFLFMQAENNYYLLFCEEKEDEVLDYYLVKIEIDFDDQHQNEIQLAGSCNGLVCLAYSSPLSSYFYIWDPLTHYWRKFTDPYLLSFNYRTSWGFAYVSSEDDYKVVRLIQDFSTLELIVHVFSLQTQKWRCVHDHGLDHSVDLSKAHPGVLVGETLYWFMDTRGLTRNAMVVGFNLALEKFEKVQGLVPRSITPWNHSLCVMGGSLSLYGLSMPDQVYMSILNRAAEVESMYLPPELGPQFCSGLVGFTRAGRFFLVSKNWEVALIDPNVSPTLYTPLVTFKKDRRPSISCYVPSLISPSSMSELQKY